MFEEHPGGDEEQHSGALELPHPYMLGGILIAIGAFLVIVSVIPDVAVVTEYVSWHWVLLVLGILSVMPDLALRVAGGIALVTGLIVVGYGLMAGKSRESGR